MRKDILPYYRALGLNPGAGPVEIRRAWRQMVQQWHPDLYKPGSLMQKTAEDITKEANEAYGQLYRKKLYRQYPPKEEREEEEPPAAAPRVEPVPTQAEAPPKPAKRAAPPPKRAGRRSRPPTRLWGYTEWEERLVRIFRARRTKTAAGVVLGLAGLPLCWAIWQCIPSFPGPVSIERFPRSEAAAEPTPPAAPSRMPEGSPAAEAAKNIVASVPQDPDLPYRRFTTDSSLQALVASTQSLILPPRLRGPTPTRWGIAPP